MNKPIIGIVAKYHDGDDQEKRVDSRIRNEVKQAIFDNGGIGIGIISPNKEIHLATDEWYKNVSKINQEYLIEQIKLCDGIVLQGGNADEIMEPFIAKYCYENNIPCLGICGGQNSIVRALKGTTYRIPNPIEHMQNDKDYVHNVKIDKSSKFYEIINKEKIMVNSRHIRSIKECPLLNKVGFCDDGYADVVEAKDKLFYIGVRFHPESLYKIDDDMNNIFKYFINVCKNENNRKELLNNLDKIHTTSLGIEIIKKNLKLKNNNVISYLNKKITNKNCIIYKKGKNYYCEIDNIRITINSYNYSIITVHEIE